MAEIAVARPYRGALLVLAAGDAGGTTGRVQGAGNGVGAIARAGGKLVRASEILTRADKLHALSRHD